MKPAEERHKTIARIACPRCEAAAGVSCRDGKKPRVSCHPERVIRANRDPKLRRPADPELSPRLAPRRPAHTNPHQSGVHGLIAAVAEAFGAR